MSPGMAHSRFCSLAKSRRQRSGYGGDVVIDCFTFHNELELLEIRLEELSPVVDLFVLAESGYTFSGNPKPRYFQESVELFAKYPIHYVDVPFVDGGAWDREYFARNYMVAALPPGNPDDVILLSDVDEIPSARGVIAAKSMLLEGAPQISFNQRLSYYYVNMAGGEWHGTVARLRRNLVQGQRMRDSRDTEPMLADGWHFSYLGGAARIRQKIESFCDVQYNEEKYKNLEHLEECLGNGSDLFFRGNTYTYVPIDDTFPKYLVSNQDRFASILKKDSHRVGISSTSETSGSNRNGPAHEVASGLKINLGSKQTKFSGFVNVDVLPGEHVDLIGSAINIPVPDKSVSVLYHSAVFEHVFVGQHDLAMREAQRVLAEDGVHIGLSIPDFRMIARLYLEDAPGLFGQRFDLFNAYRYTHGEPEQCRAGWDQVGPTEPPPTWIAQLHKCIFDSDYLHQLLSPWPHVVFRFCAKNEPYPLNLGFVVFSGGLDISKLLSMHTPWVPESVLELSSIEPIAPSGRTSDMLLGLR
jgi:beta-1,4-mannosyl-glycoprotein beta-1,4-N-acetylglucosaminyltransferase